MPEDYKKQLREMLADIFDSRTGFMVSALGLGCELKPLLVNDTLVIQAPVTFESQLREFLSNEGFFITSYNKNVFWVSVVSC